MDRRTHHRLAQPLPPFGQGLGVPQPKGLGVLAPSLNPSHAAKALSKNSMIPDRLLGKAQIQLDGAQIQLDYAQPRFGSDFGQFA